MATVRSMIVASVVGVAVSSSIEITHDVQTAGFSFMTIGDWGGAALDRAQYGLNVKAVANQMATQTTAINSQFIVGTGDNFYWCGLMNSSDYQIQADWVGPYSHTTPSLLDQKWYNVLGNHEYGYNVEANFEISKKFPSWVQDGRYYTKRLALDASNSLSLIFIDSSPCVQEYRSSDNSGWDPCGSAYPTCSIKNPSDPNDHFEGPCEFNKNIVAQDCSTQLTWFKQALAAVPKDDWLIIVGHHPLDEMDVEDFVTPLFARGFDLYLNGHAHTLTHYAINSKPAFVTSGAGAMVDTSDHVPTTPGKERTYNKTLGLPLKEYRSNQYTSIWNQKVAGFNTHTFSSDFSELTTNFVTFDGQTPHTFTVKKGQAPPPSPPPSPPSPTPKGGCCHSTDGKCAKGTVCCKSGCDSPSSCSYTEEGCKSSSYAKKHGCYWADSKICLVGM